MEKHEASDYQSQKDKRWVRSRLASTRDLSTIAFFPGRSDQLQARPSCSLLSRLDRQTFRARKSRLTLIESQEHRRI